MLKYYQPEKMYISKAAPCAMEYQEKVMVWWPGIWKSNRATSPMANLRFVPPGQAKFH
jgi:hypothetical protein